MSASHSGPPVRLDARASHWYLATRLDERVAAGSAALGDAGHAAAARRLDALREQFPYSDDELFTRMLRQRGLTPLDFAAVCQETAEEVRMRFAQPPPWLSKLHGMPLVGTADAPFLASAPGLPGAQPGHRQDRMARLLGFLSPVLERGIDTLTTGVRDILRSSGSVTDADRMGELLARTWPRRALTRLVLRVLILELNVARLQGKLTGTDSEARFAEFASWLSDPVRCPLLWESYPLLLRECCATVDAWVAARLEFCSHLCADRELVDELAPAAGARELTDVAFEAGDGHRGGRSVGILTFADGGKVVYKPRSLAVDQHFQALLSWANDEGFEPAFPVLRVVGCGDHGWSQCVAPSDCTDPEQVGRFYRRHGGYLALAHALRATDLHFENVIAAGEFPYLVDLEALFGADLHRAGGSSDEVASALTASTVLATGLLPNPVVSFDDADGGRTDLSGMAYRPGQLTPGKVATWADPATDTMRIVHRRMPMGGSRNTPSLAGRAVLPTDHVTQVTAGFEAMYRILHRRKSELASPGGMLESFRGDTVRRVLEATETYSAFLWDSYHPNLLRNGVDRDRYLDRTLTRYDSLRVGPSLAASERRQLADGDIPLFTSTVDGRGLTGGEGTVIDDALETTGLQAARDRIMGLSAADMEHQQWVIRSAFACVATEELHSSWPVHTVTTTDHNVAPSALIDHARRIGGKLLASAVRTAEEIGWLGICPSGPSAWRLGPTLSGMYSGAAGIAFFLMHLGLVTGNAGYTEAAADVARSLARRVRRNSDLPPPPAEVPALGLTGEVDGGLYFVAHWSAATGDLGLLADMIDHVLPRLRKTVRRTTASDLVDGLAGTLMALSAAHHVLPSDAVAEVMEQCAEAVVRARTLLTVGAGWAFTAAGDRPLCGMSHGASGIALALARCAQRLGTTRYDEVIQDALRYEDSLVDPERRCWPDLRPASGDRTMTAWCHGAPGIGTARATLAAYGDPGIAKAAAAGLETAVEATLRHYGDAGVVTVRNLSLCHGELGNLDFLATATRGVDNPAARIVTARLTHAVCATLDERGPICGVPEGISTPGLMTGIAGIGYGLLRSAAPDRLPDVLSFEPPRPAHLTAGVTGPKTSADRRNGSARPPSGPGTDD
ncbi:type 2 lanthipeptide synthetase LanM family protein [Streptomyces bugieae]|uniref:Type 2 lanthipeptide synthetase LanM family protein n=1 Tax=Streptomyces bugieae TaxID=3098223 RepID=A0ABU7NP23_9ACTN|nr:type 2 lanthipeptide synthetase LanM family protein [Streptomyces sp. DSM 41528]